MKEKEEGSHGELLVMVQRNRRRTEEKETEEARNLKWRHCTGFAYSQEYPSSISQKCPHALLSSFSNTLHLIRSGQVKSGFLVL